MFEIDAMHIQDVLLQIEAHTESRKEAWEMVRANAYITAKYGNSDSKKFPKTPEKFWPFSWESEGKKKLNPKELMEEYHKRFHS